MRNSTFLGSMFLKVSTSHINTANVFANKNTLFTVVDYYKLGITNNAANSTITLYHRAFKKF